MGATGATVQAAPATILANETLGGAASLGAERPTVLVVRATVQEEDTLGAVASVWAVARALVKPIQHAAVVVLALDPVVGHMSRLRICDGRTTNRGDC